MLIAKAEPGPGAPCAERARRLEGWTRSMSVPRHYLAEPAANRRVRDLVADELRSFGYRVSLTDSCDNVVALPAEGVAPTLVGAHYDSVPGTPGADDNASAVAVLLESARELAGQAPVGFVAFNREEEGLLGSREFAEHLPANLPTRPERIHVLEMLGYCSREEGSQVSPLPFKLPGMPTVGDFLGVLADHRSRRLLDQVVRCGRGLPGGPRVVGLKALFGAQRCLPNLERSDHAPFWAQGVPALMWTDTAEFRNANYHLPSDTPETLDYGFMASISALLLKVLGAP
jgi:peptidase M28-like protein